MAQRGANLSPVDTHGWTPLDLAKVSRHLKMVAMLARLGAVCRYAK
jgi:ankyrin repeat protein